jgi:transcriptional regulator with XRE-family HTH domain
MAVDRKLLLFIAKLKKISILKTATANDISQAQLSRFFGGKKGGYLGEEKIEKVSRFLGVDYKTGKLLPGVHRWLALKSWTIRPTPEEMKNSEEIFRVLFAEGLRYLFVVDQEHGPNPVLGLKVVVPVVQPDIRVLILCTSMEGKFLWPNIETGWSFRNNLSGWEDSRIYLPHSAFLRLMRDETLTVAELDLLLGVNGNSGWTWERLNAVLEEKGIIPEEVAQKYGLS